MRRFVVGVTGASGTICARSILRELVRHAEVERVHLVLSQYALLTINAELGCHARDEAEAARALLEEAAATARAGRSEADGASKIVLHRSGDMAAAVSSGSYPCDGMVVVPCSGGTLAAIANGTSTNLVQRAAEVTLKERRPLILAFRESPLSLVHAENLARASRAGAIVFPLTPSFYNRPQGIDEIVEQFTARIFDLLRLPHSLGKRWGAPR
ncbi:MAG TPA: UbiX family flavin prenyltransferase [Candidatus Polarisedimenticolia bacterium]|nr:UbiX family flavin prenyltransferase [Candidatus Polarisedimenticolia bacterium]